MPESQRPEVGQRKDNILYSTAFHLHSAHRDVRPAGSAEEIGCDPISDLWVRIAAIPRRNGLLMVGG
jgi:hypothetical protein